jgi:hypothetical protein
MTMAMVRDLVVALLAILVLLTFMWLYGADLWKARSRGYTMVAASQQIDDPRTYVATAVAALVGGVAAVFLGVEMPGAQPFADWPDADYIKLAYVAVYIPYGAAAIVTWVRLNAQTPLTIRNLAVTFIGLVTPAVATYLGVAATANG